MKQKEFNLLGWIAISVVLSFSAAANATSREGLYSWNFRAIFCPTSSEYLPVYQLPEVSVSSTVSLKENVSLYFQAIANGNVADLNALESAYSNLKIITMPPGSEFAPESENQSLFFTSQQPCGVKAIAVGEGRNKSAILDEDHIRNLTNRDHAKLIVDLVLFQLDQKAQQVQLKLDELNRAIQEPLTLEDLAKESNPEAAIQTAKEKIAERDALRAELTGPGTLIEQNRVRRELYAEPTAYTEAQIQELIQKSERKIDLQNWLN